MIDRSDAINEKLLAFCNLKIVNAQLNRSINKLSLEKSMKYEISNIRYREVIYYVMVCLLKTERGLV